MCMPQTIFIYICHLCCVSWWKLDLLKVKIDVCVRYNRISAYCVPTLCVPSKKLIGCIGRSQGQKKVFNATFKNILVWNYKAQNIHIWYIASSRGSLPKLFKLCPWGQNLPRPGGHHFTWNYIRKTCDLQTTSCLEPLMGIWQIGFQCNF